MSTTTTFHNHTNTGERPRVNVVKRHVLWGGTPWRTSAAMYCALPVLAAVVVYILLYHPLADSLRSGYAASMVLSANSAIIVVLPCCGAIFAWDIASLKRGGILSVPHGRSLLHVVVSRGMPTLVLGCFAMAVAWGLVLAHCRSMVTDHDVIAMAGALIRIPAAMSVALLIALVSPYWLAPPLAMVLNYLPIVYAPAVDIFWLQHVNGFYYDGLPSDMQIALRPVFASMVVSVGLMMCAVIVVLVWGTSDRVSAKIATGRFVLCALGCVGVMLAALLAGRALALPYGSFPGEPRTSGQVCERMPGDSASSGHGELTVCLWQEHHDLAKAVARQTVEVRGHLDAVGYSTPSRIVEAAPGSSGWVIGVDNAMDERQLRMAIVNGLHSTTLRLETGQCQVTSESYLRHLVAQQWLYRVTGVDGSTNQGDIPGIDAVQHDFDALSNSQKVVWVRAVMTEQADMCR
ncbi:hypothetical protein ACLUWU_07915 [Bifidobacterium thermophilum]|uniref:DUF7224 domain-containing protein n=1 Tax=Bifidobacterium thermophilum TaxID=33905 RepID=UPI0039941F49